MLLLGILRFNSTTVLLPAAPSVQTLKFKCTAVASASNTINQHHQTTSYILQQYLVHSVMVSVYTKYTALQSSTSIYGTRNIPEIMARKRFVSCLGLWLFLLDSAGRSSLCYTCPVEGPSRVVRGGVVVWLPPCCSQQENVPKTSSSSNCCY